MTFLSLIFLQFQHADEGNVTQEQVLQLQDEDMQHQRPVIPGSKRRHWDCGRWHQRCE